MHFKNIIFAFLLPLAFAKSTNSNNNLSKSQLKEVAGIARELNIDESDAGKIFEFINQDHHYESCESQCKKEVKKLKVKNSKKITNDLRTICEGKCFISNTEILEEEEKEEEPKKSKLAGSAVCDPISRANVKLVSSSFGSMGYPKYKDAGSVKTALSEVNGCGPKQAVFGISNTTLKKIPLLLDGTFEPGCNSHDICYACNFNSKSYCDERLKSNLNSICDRAYNKKNHPFYNHGCKVQANVFYAAVAVGGKNAYAGTSVNTSARCAACGVSTIRNSLVSHPFYV